MKQRYATRKVFHRYGTRLFQTPEFQDIAIWSPACGQGGRGGDGVAADARDRPDAPEADCEDAAASSDHVPEDALDRGGVLLSAACPNDVTCRLPPCCLPPPRLPSPRDPGVMAGVPERASLGRKARGAQPSRRRGGGVHAGRTSSGTCRSSMCCTASSAGCAGGGPRAAGCTGGGPGASILRGPHARAARVRRCGARGACARGAALHMYTKKKGGSQRAHVFGESPCPAQTYATPLLRGIAAQGYDTRM